jgi:hypothetical protein
MINFRFLVFNFGLSILFEELFGKLPKVQAGLGLTGWQPVLSRVVHSAA